MSNVSDRELVKTWYHSLLSDGTLWCESSDPEEVLRLSEGYNCTFHKVEVYQYSSGPLDWNPTHEQHRP